MSSGGEPSAHFHLESNRVPVTGDNKVRLYFAQFSRALKALQRTVEEGSGTTNAESKAVSQAVDRLRRTFESLSLKYFYSGTGHELKIDSTDSGFPHFSTLIEMAADLDGRDAGLSGLPTLSETKQAMLDQILRYSLHPRKLQAGMLRRLYLEGLQPEAIFRAFLPGALEKVGAADDESSYFWSFTTYDRSLNRPFVYLVYFTHEGPRLEPEGETFDAICGAAERCAAGQLSLLAFSHRWDELLPEMRPRIVKRLILGPYHAPFFTEPDPELGELLEELALRLPFALRWEAETLISEREARVGKGWLSKGQLRQVFWIPKSVDLARRGVSQVERFLVVPHWLAQHVQARGILPDHRHLTVDDDETSHGID